MNRGIIAKFKHWTPRYVWDRILVAFFQLRNPHAPWLTADAIAILEDWLSYEDRGLEFGSGRSTLWFAERVDRLVSVEHNRTWYERVAKLLNDAGFNNVEYLFRPSEGSGSALGGQTYWDAAEHAPDHSFDFVLVDGADRSKCALASLGKIKPGGILIIDNVNWALPSGSRSPASRSNEQGPVSEEWAFFLERVKGWRRIWTTNGVTDTAIFVKGLGLDS